MFVGIQDDNVIKCKIMFKLWLYFKFYHIDFLRFCFSQWFNVKFYVSFRTVAEEGIINLQFTEIGRLRALVCVQFRCRPWSARIPCSTKNSLAVTQLLFLSLLYSFSATSLLWIAYVSKSTLHERLILMFSLISMTQQEIH